MMIVVVVVAVFSLVSSSIQNTENTQTDRQSVGQQNTKTEAGRQASKQANLLLSTKLGSHKCVCRCAGTPHG